jgi:hypothetical protein
MAEHMTARARIVVTGTLGLFPGFLGGQEPSSAECWLAEGKVTRVSLGSRAAATTNTSDFSFWTSATAWRLVHRIPGGREVVMEDLGGSGGDVYLFRQTGVDGGYNMTPADPSGSKDEAFVTEGDCPRMASGLTQVLWMALRGDGYFTNESALGAAFLNWGNPIPDDQTVAVATRQGAWLIRVDGIATNWMLMPGKDAVLVPTPLGQGFENGWRNWTLELMDPLQAGNQALPRRATFTRSFPAKGGDSKEVSKITVEVVRLNTSAPPDSWLPRVGARRQSVWDFRQPPAGEGAEVSASKFGQSSVHTITNSIWVARGQGVLEESWSNAAIAMKSMHGYGFSRTTRWLIFLCFAAVAATPLILARRRLAARQPTPQTDGQPGTKGMKP